MSENERMLQLVEKALATNPPATAPEVVRGELLRQTATTTIDQASREAERVVKLVVGQVGQETRSTLEQATKEMRASAEHVELSVKDVLVQGTHQIRAILWLAAGLWFGGSIVLELVRLACRFATGIL